MIKIFTDTSSNLTAAVIKEYNLGLVPFSYTVDGVEAKPDPNVDFDGKAYYDAMRSGAEVKTSMVNGVTFTEAVRESLDAGDDVIYIGMSGGISGTAQIARLAAEELRADYPERKIASIDTYAASLGEGLLVVKAARMLRDGASFDRIVAEISKDRETMCQYFTVDDLEYLKRGGRLGRVATVVGTVLKIKPILMGDAKGQIVLCAKTRGRKQSLMALADYYEKLSCNRKAMIGIAHADAPVDAALLLEELKLRGFAGECLTVCYEPVTGAHVGPGTVALFFPGTHK